MTTIQILGIVVTAVMTVSFLRHLRSGKLRKDYLCLRVLKGWKWLPAIISSWIVLALIICVGTLLLTAWPQAMGWSWLSVLAQPKDGPTAGRNVLVSGLTVPGFAWVFLVLFASNVPRLAMNEELAFRKGHKDVRSIALNSLKFGMTHCLVGVPIGFGLALSIGGLWFALQYLKGGVRRSAAYHAIHNWTLLGLAALWLLKVI